MSKRVAQNLGKQQIGWAEILTCDGMRLLESAAMASGAVTGLELMERAGSAVAGHIRLRFPKGRRATVLCGPGNNGGDGYVIARLLARAGWEVRVLGLDNTPGPDAAEMKHRWAEMGRIAPLREFGQQGPGDVYVDAIFGIGLTRAPQGEIAEMLARLRGEPRFAARTVAVDAPSGLCLDSGRIVGAEGPGGFAQPVRLTVTFDRPKVGHLIAFGPQICGELVTADIGLTPWREMDNPRAIDGHWRGSPRALTLAQAVPCDGEERGEVFGSAGSLSKPPCGGMTGTGQHKFSYGHAVVVAGGPGKGGAARLSAQAALRVGAGLVTLAPPPDALSEHTGKPDALMRRGLDSAGDLVALLQDPRVTAVTLGPGCGVDRAGELLEPLLQDGRACVLDADALTALAGRGFSGLTDRCVLTPHGGEFARLFPDLADRLADPRDGVPYSKLDATRDAAARSGAVVLFKGPDTVIADPTGRACIHSALDVPWLATAGAGDVLTGIIAGLLARGLSALQAAGLGATLHASAARRFGPGLIADDLPDQLPGVFRDLGL